MHHVRVDTECEPVRGAAQEGKEVAITAPRVRVDEGGLVLHLVEHLIGHNDVGEHGLLGRVVS